MLQQFSSPQCHTSLGEVWRSRGSQPPNSPSPRSRMVAGVLSITKIPALSAYSSNGVCAKASMTSNASPSMDATIGGSGLDTLHALSLARCLRAKGILI
ncbi:hypothetical protein Tco_0343237 [Tanacetum coccineum]